MVGVIQDITERKQAEQIKNDFLSTISHELRTPLTSIRGSLGLILGGALNEKPDKITELLQVANSNSDRLLLLINDLLDLQKIEAGKMKYNFREVSPFDLLEEVIKINTPYANKHNVTLQLTQTSKCCHDAITIDADRLIQVMTNLISNAVKFSPPGECVEVEHYCSDSSVKITVNDRGPGVPETFQAHLFDRFTQADGSQKWEHSGTGLGLNIAQLIVDEHGGTIAYEDNPGGGSRFSVTLPLTQRAS
jgi:signal transduction histidine kinase